MNINILAWIPAGATVPPITGDPTAYTATGKAGQNVVTSSLAAALPGPAIGSNVLVSDAGPSLSLSLPNVSFTQAPTFVLGNSIGAGTFPAPLNLTAYDTIKMVCSAVDDGSGTFGSMTVGGLFLNLIDATGTVQSSTCCQHAVAPNPGFFNFNLDHRGNLSAIVAFSFVLNLATTKTGIQISHLGYNQNGLLPTSGVGFVFTFHGGIALSDLRASITAITPTTITLSVPLASAVPAIPADGTVIEGNYNGGVYRDETAALQKLIVSVGNAGTIEFPTGCRIPVSATINTAGVIGQRWVGDGCVGGAAPTSGNPGLLWNGPCGQPLLCTNNSRDTLWENLVFLGLGRHEPSSLIEIDMPGNIPVPQETTNQHFSRCYLQGPINFPRFAPVCNSRTATNNCEDMLFEHCWFWTSQTPYEGGFGFQNGPSFNAKSILLWNCKFANGNYGLFIQNGSFAATDCSGDRQQWCGVVENTAESSRFIGHNSEDCVNGVKVRSQWPMEIGGGRFSNLLLPNQSAPFYFSSSYVHLHDNKVAPLFVPTTPMPNNLVDCDVGNATYTVSINNSWVDWNPTTPIVGVIPGLVMWQSLAGRINGRCVDLMSAYQNTLTPNLIQAWFYPNPPQSTVAAAG